MSTAVNRTHSPEDQSWVRSAVGHADFPLQNLPLGVFSVADGARRLGTVIGDRVLDLSQAVDDGLFREEGEDLRRALMSQWLNEIFSLPGDRRMALRQRLWTLLVESATERSRVEGLLHPLGDCAVHMPANVGDYTDFFAGIQHAKNAGKLFRPDTPLLPNYKHVPVGYHGRSSSLRVSGVDVLRPRGQIVSAGTGAPAFQPTRKLDYELELGIWMAEGNELGAVISIDDAWQHIAGFCLLNDWSARDIQAWEYQPLGPFLAKNFITSVSPWVVTREAIEPFRCSHAAREADAPPLQGYLDSAEDRRSGALSLQLTVAIRTARMQERGREPHVLGRVSSTHLYWTVAQLIAHHTSNGCNLRPGDLLGSGTISGTDPSAYGSLLEITRGGLDSVELPDGESRTFLEDGDEVCLRAHAVAPSFVSIGFGECRATIRGART